MLPFSLSIYTDVCLRSNQTELEDATLEKPRPEKDDPQTSGELNQEGKCVQILGRTVPFRGTLPWG